MTGLSGVAPRAWLGNYRVFTVPTPIGHVANTPEIIAAFEAAVQDGMDVINFSGGGPQTDPANDALIEAIHNVAAAGVVPVIAAGNDRDDFGLGSAGSPGTAPDAISVAAVSNTHVFAPALDVTAPNAPDVVKGIPFMGAERRPHADRMELHRPDARRRRLDRRTRRHCGGAASLRSANGDLASTRRAAASHSLDGAIALVQRGLCPFVTKAEQARRRAPLASSSPTTGRARRTGSRCGCRFRARMIANLDGDHLRAYLTAQGGRTTIRVGSLRSSSRPDAAA